MKTKYKLNKNELVLDINFLYDVGFNENNIDDILKYVNRFLNNHKINFKGNRIVIYVDGIFIGTLHTTIFYLKKMHLKSNYLELNQYNSYFEKQEILEISN